MEIIIAENRAMPPIENIARLILLLSRGILLYARVRAISGRSTTHTAEVMVEGRNTMGMAMPVSTP